MERLNKYLAHAGVGSRRHCDELIVAGRVKINGQTVRDLGLKVDPAVQKVSVDDQPVKGEKAVYWVVHKPPGYLCTDHDPGRRPLAKDLIPHVEQRVYTVGRLDEASEGMLLMTNDGELANSLMHPRFGVEKTYLVLVAGRPAPADLQQLLDGVWLSDGKVKAKSVRRVKAQGESTWIRVVLCEGKNREIRRMLAKLNHKVLRLRRVAIGPVLLDRLPKGKARKLSLPEVELLQQTVAATKAKIARATDKARGLDVGPDPDDAPPAAPVKPPVLPPVPAAPAWPRTGPEPLRGQPGTLVKPRRAPGQVPPKPRRPGPAKPVLGPGMGPRPPRPRRPGDPELPAYPTKRPAGPPKRAK